MELAFFNDEDRDVKIIYGHAECIHANTDRNIKRRRGKYYYPWN